ncbi:MAG TPA: DUF4214 domain-containing protein [Bryobacteraceae bacterium]|nr:DUF4214 domain-containing protein [Bryobacteraceae bacterium]
MNRRLILLAFASVALVNAQNFSTTDAAMVITPPRSSSTASTLLFAFVSNQLGYDTEITLSNTSQDPFGSTPGSGTCTLYYYGSNPPAGPQTTAAIAAGQQIVFDVSTGGSGVAAAPGFQGYIAANCGFPLALGFAKLFGLVGFGPETSQDAQVLTLPRSPASPQYLLFPFLTNQNGMDSGIVLTNSSQDPFGTSPAAGTCTLNFYGANAPSPLTTPSIPAGQQYITTVSAVAPSFQGYAIATCNFPDAAGTGFVQQTAAPHNTWPANPELLTLPRAGGASPALIFPFASNKNGNNDGLIAIANTSLDPAGTTPGSGTCSLSFNGNNAPPSAFTTPTIAAGTVYTTYVSQIAPGFEGTVLVNCTFPQTRALELVGSANLAFAYGSIAAQSLVTPNSSAPTDLLLPAISSANGYDTLIVIANGSPAGSAAGTCTISFFGTVNGGSVPGPQTTTAVSSSSALEIDLEQGGAGLATVPGFSGYLTASCNFLARGVAAVVQQGPNLAITSNHTGNFTQGQQGATYTLLIGNSNNAQATIGTTTVTENLPAGLTLVSMAGTGWTCPSGQNTCTRNDSLAEGSYYPTITVTVNVSATAGSQLVNSVSVSTGNEGAVTGTDPTTIVQGPVITAVGSGVTGLPVLSPGTQAVVSGTNLGSSTNLPMVMVGNLQGYVVSTGANFVFFEIPTNAPLGPATVTVTVAGVSSNAFPITLGQYSPVLRTNGMADGVPLCTLQNGSSVSPSNAPNVGDSVTCQGYGWGPTNPVVGTGQNAPSNPQALTTTTPIVMVGGLQAVVSSAGLEPNVVATYIVTFKVPAVAPGYQTLTLSIGGLTSNPVTLPVGTPPVGTILEFPIPTANSTPRGLTVGPDGNLWFTETAAGNVGRVTPAGAFSEYGVPTASATPEEIIAGPDGDLWFAEFGAAKIGRVSTAGVFGGEFPTPTGASKPFGIAQGPDYIWFTEYGVGKIGKMNAVPAVGTVGAAVEFTTPTSGSNPPRIALGPDGGYWFTEQAANKIGHSTSTGSITEYPIPTAGSSPWGIVAGPDGNMWFTEGNANQIGRITPNGTITEFPVTTTNAGPSGITVGPDGALWFTEITGNQIGRITTSGTVTNEYPIPTAGSQPIDIVTGPDGGMWFTEGFGNKIGRLNTSFTSAPVLSITVTAAASFTQAQVGATYTLTVSSAAGAGPTNGTVTVEEALPSGLGLISMAGTGWTCSGITCTTSNVLAGGASYPPITVTVDVSGDELGSYNNSVQVYGGGSAISTATDNVTINPQAIDGISEYPIPTSGAIPHGITSGPDGALWFAEESGNKIGRITTTGVESEFVVPTSGAAVEDITTGPDGAIWFGETGAGKIGRITTAGTITESPVPTPGLAPFGIVTGPDGNLWFVEAAQTGVSKIGRMSTSGNSVDFPIPTSGAAATQIAVGPDGALWFTEAMGNNIGRITTAGTITEFPTAAGSNPWNIVAGPDGALWFTETGTAKIGRITLAGTITEFPVPSGNSPLNLGIGPDDAIWFTEPSGNQIGTVTTAGVFNEFPTPTAGSHPESIVAGLDSGMWFTEGQGNNIGRVSTARVNATPVLSIQSAHTGNFTAGQTGATYMLTVSNSGGRSIGLIGVMENLPAGMALVSMTGSGWTCSGNNCTTAANVPNGGSLPAITVTVNVAGSAPSPLANVVTVYGGGSILAFASDSTIVTGGSSCTYTLSPPPPMPPVPSGAGSGTVMVTTQSGCAWTASSDSPWLTVNSGSSGSGAGTVNYSVAAYTGTTERTGILTIAGLAFPVTQLPPPLLTITSSHTGNFFQGETGAVYAIVVGSTAGTSPPSGSVTVTENLPSSLTLVSLSGSGWTCAANSCTTAGALLPGASYPAITVTVNVASNAPAQVTNQASVSGGGSASESASDATTIAAATCSFTLGSTSTSLTQIGTASAGGFAPENPLTVGITPVAGASCSASYTVSSSAPWLSATTNGASFTYTALSNAHSGPQTGTLTITNAHGGSATFTVSEAGNPEPLLNRQVRALYESVLGRDPDSGGFTFWTGVGSAGLGQMLDSFVTSPESFNTDFAVMTAYQAATGSAPSYAEFIGSVAAVRAGTSLSTLFNSLTPSGYTAQNLYQNLLGRAPTSAEVNSAGTAGLAQWFETLIAYPSSVTPVTAANNEFMNTGTFAEGPDHSNGLYIAMLYFVILGRDYDAGGYAFWVGVANSGGPGILFQGAAGYPTRIQILGPGTPGQGFAGSPEFQGLYQ